jgi:hypothetical protein
VIHFYNFTPFEVYVLKHYEKGYYLLFSPFFCKYSIVNKTIGVGLFSCKFTFHFYCQCKITQKNKFLSNKIGDRFENPSPIFITLKLDFYFFFFLVLSTSCTFCASSTAFICFEIYSEKRDFFAPPPAAIFLRLSSKISLILSSSTNLRIPIC